MQGKRLERPRLGGVVFFGGSGLLCTKYAVIFYVEPRVGKPKGFWYNLFSRCKSEWRNRQTR